jgi:hypothetical protein
LGQNHHQAGRWGLSFPWRFSLVFDRQITTNPRALHVARRQDTVTERSVVVQILERPVQFQDKSEARSCRGRSFHFLSLFVTCLQCSNKRRRRGGMMSCLPACFFTACPCTWLPRNRQPKAFEYTRGKAVPK